jgi:hypothetical protein
MKLPQLLNYCTSRPNSKLLYIAIDMILNIHSDSGYVSESEAMSRAGGNLFMSSQPYKGEQQHNCAILALSTIIRMVVASAVEAEMGA